MRRGRALSLGAVLGFAVLLGVFAWRTLFGYVEPDYRRRLVWEAPWISHPTSELDHAYFRKKISITSKPIHAWLAVMAPDQFTLFVNGQSVEAVEYRSGYAQKVFDLTPLLIAGTNVIAIHNEVATFPQRARIVAQGRYLEATGNSFEIRSDADWRTTWRDESLVSQGAVAATPWYQPEYDDGRWAHAVAGNLPRPSIVQPLEAPPAVFTTPVQGAWLWTDDPRTPEAFLRLTVDLTRRPRDAWLRIAAKRHARLLVNGWSLSIHEDTIGTLASEETTLRVFNITPFLTRGRNVVAVHVANERTDRGVIVDGFVEGPDGRPTWFASTDWRVSPGPVPGWTTSGFDDSRWEPATALKPVSAREQALLVKKPAMVAPPLSYHLATLTRAGAVLLASVVGCLVLWTGMAVLLGRLTGAPAAEGRRWLGLTVLPPAALLVIACLLGFDPRFSPSFPFQPAILSASVALLLALNLGVLVAAFWRRADAGVAARLDARGPSRANRGWRDPGFLLAMGLAVVGFVLRFRDLTREQLHGDEAGGLAWTLGILERGYPSSVLDGRIKPIFTSELVYYLKAPAVWLFGPNTFGMRVTDVVFGTLTILLLYWVGRTFHGRRVGLLAAAVYTIMPSAIGLTHHGRYQSQLQFFALLTFALFFRAFGEGAFRPRRYAAAVAAILATFLSWEGSAFYLPALVLGVFALTRPDFSWLKNPRVWAGAGLVMAVIFLQLSLRFINKHDWPVYGISLTDVQLTFMWRHPFYDPTYYLGRFFLLENHHLLTLLFALGALLWGRPSREGRILAFMAVTLLADLALMTNLLEIGNWRYVHYLFPLLVLSASMVLVIFFDALVALARAVPVGATWMRATARATGLVLIGTFLLFSTSFVVKLYELPWSYTAQYTRLGLRFNPALQGAVEYVRWNLQPGDVVVTVSPQVLQFHLDRVDHFVESKLRQVLVAGSESQLPLNKYTGAPTILTAADLRERYAGVSRIWYVTYSSLWPDPELAPMLQNARVMYEDWHAVVLLFGSAR